MKAIEQLDSRGRKVIRVKQSPEELRDELARLQFKHLRFLSMAKSVKSLEPEELKPN